MQEKEQNISPIKQRILHLIDLLNISKRDFYLKTGISRGTLESSTGITEDTLAKLFATYQNVNQIYILTGNGEPFQNTLETLQVEEDKGFYVRSKNENQEDKIALLYKTIGKLEYQIELLKEENEKLKQQLDSPKST